jgi:bisphosphoglycerate-dependent phosphoglycerate mutase
MKHLKINNMNRACLPKNTNLHEQNQHASSIRPIKNNIVRMKKLLLLIIGVAIAMNLIAQSDYDGIGRNEFYLIKTGSSVKSNSTPKASNIKNSKIAEQLFGSQHNDQKQFFETKHAYFKIMTYADGLELVVPENQKLDMNFHIRSNKYTMLVNNGQVITVGMKSEELKAIFPKSFLKRAIIGNIEGQKGKMGMIVYFTRIVDGKVIMEDSWITFIFSEDNGILEEFYTWEPS